MPTAVMPASLKRRQALGQRAFCAALVCLLVLSEVFSSNIQSTLPGFSWVARLLLTGLAVLLLTIKCLFLTWYPLRRQWILIFFAVGYSAFASLYGDDNWFVLAVLVGLAAKDVDLRTALRTYLVAAISGLVLVQLLHHTTSLIPYQVFARNWDFGSGHYNGYGARLLGIFLTWVWLRWPRLRWMDWLGLCGVAIYTLLVPVCRGAGGAMLLILGLFALQKLFPRLFDSRLWYAFVFALYPLLYGASLLSGYLFDPSDSERTPVLSLVNRILSGRLEVWHHVFWSFPYTHPAEEGAAAWYHGDMPSTLTLLGGLPTAGDVHHAVDNTYLALIMNKGILGAVLTSIVILVLLWRLCRGRHTGETILWAAMLCYFMMENKIFLVSANPLLLLLPCALLTPSGTPLPTLSPTPGGKHRLTN